MLVLSCQKTEIGQNNGQFELMVQVLCSFQSCVHILLSLSCYTQVELGHTRLIFQNLNKCKFNLHLFGNFKYFKVVCGI